MTYFIQPVDLPLVWVDPADVAGYIAQGWTQATTAQVNAFLASDPYAGNQQVKPAPKLRSAPNAIAFIPVPTNKHVT